MIRRPPRSPLFPSTPLFRSVQGRLDAQARAAYEQGPGSSLDFLLGASTMSELSARLEFVNRVSMMGADLADRKSTRLNSSHANISYAVFCLKKNNNTRQIRC